MANGYEKTYEAVLPRLKNRVFPEIALRLGFDLLTQHSLGLDFLGRPYVIGPGGVEPADGKDVHVNIKSVLVYYAVSRGRGEPLGEYCLLHYFSRGLFTGAAPAPDWMTSPLRKKYAGDYKSFALAARGLGMEEAGGGKPDVQARHDTHTWQYRLLPKIPVRVVYYEADDEFPCDIQIRYDKTAITFLDFEPLAVLTGCFINALARENQ
jgi:hypothetical protein